MDVNNNLANVTLKVKCDLCEKSFFVEFLSKHMRVSHPGVERPVKKKTQNLIDKNDLKFFCKFCNKGFAVKREMKRHKKKVHLSSGNSKAVEKLIWKKLKPIENGCVHCSDCNKTLSGNKSARSHYLQWHMAKNDGNTFVCKLCNEEFTTKYVLMNHLQEIHGRTKIPKGILSEKLEPFEDGRMKCLDCNKLFSSKETARTHYQKLHLDERYICRVCSKKFTTEGYMKKHMKVAHMLPKIIRNGANEKHEWKIVKPNEDGQINCLDCNATFSCLHTAKAHHKVQHTADEKGNNFKCKVCNEVFSVKYALKNHMREIHGRTQIPKEIIYEKLKPIEDGHMECLDCNKIFSSKETARDHYKKLHLNKRFNCSVCSRSFITEEYMKKHMKAAHMLPKMAKNESDEKCEWKIVKLNEDGRFNCLDCNQTFSSLSTAKSHHIHVHRTNHNDRKFVCVVCNNNFAVKQYLKTHMKAVHGVSYLLNCLECNKTFSNKGGLNTHLRNCHGDHTRFNCLECNKTLKKSSLHQHMKEQHRMDKTQKKFSCHLCGKHFGIERSMQSHFTKFHKAKHDGSKFICKLCNEEFTIRYFLMNHLKEIHGRIMIPKEIICEKLKPIEDGRMECLDCNKTFSSNGCARSHFAKFHMAKHDGSKLICKLCTEEFTIRYFLMNHLKEVHGRIMIPKEIIFEKLKPIEDGRMECLDCNKTFASKETARTHYKEIHMSKLIFKCEVCLKNLRHKRGLDLHMFNCHGVHYRLNCLECNKTFKKSSLNQHMKEQHWTKKNFNCKMCGKHFGLERSLKSHIRNCQEIEETENEEPEMKEPEMEEPEMKEPEIANQDFKCQVCD